VEVAVSKSNTLLEFQLIESPYKTQTNATHANQERKCLNPSLPQISPEAANYMER
jgi:hypothetical protein